MCKELYNDGRIAAFFLLPNLIGFSLFYLIPFVMDSFKDGAVGGSFVGGIGFAASILYMAPMLLIFGFTKKYLIKGIQLSGAKD